jgi:hypothetical protein
MPFYTAALAAFTAPARARPALWRLLLGLALIVGTYTAVVITAFSLAPPMPGDVEWEGRVPLSMSLMMGTFAGALAGAALAARVLHARSPMTLTGPLPRVIRDFGLALGVFAALQGLNLCLWAIFFDAVPVHRLSHVLSWLPWAALLVLVQTGTEEIVFRGYILQQLAARFRNPLIWFALPPILFAVLHSDPATNGAMNVLVVVMIGFTGLAWADLTRISGSIGAGWGWHFANNAFLMIVLGNMGQMDSFALNATPYAITDMPPLPILADLATQVTIWLVLRRILSARMAPNGARA